LKEINLKFNNLKSWPSNLNKCNSLEILDLGYNKIKDISFFFFQNLKAYDLLCNLKYLDVSSKILLINNKKKIIIFIKKKLF
jgi:hypothetical protein